jgi:hypothetical protein
LPPGGEHPTARERRQIDLAGDSILKSQKEFVTLPRYCLYGFIYAIVPWLLAIVSERSCDPTMSTSTTRSGGERQNVRAG